LTAAECCQKYSDGEKMIIMASNVQSGSGYWYGVLQVFGLTGSNNLLNYDTKTIQNATGDTRIFNIFIGTMYPAGTDPVIVVAGHTGQDYAFVQVYYYFGNTLNLLWRKLWYSSYSGDNEFTDVNVLLDDFDDDGTIEMLTFDSKKSNIYDHQNTFRFWYDFGAGEPSVENSFQFQTSN